MRILVSLAGIALAIAAPSGALAKAQDKGQPSVMRFRADNPKMNAAKASAQRTLPVFFARLASPGSDEGEFMVKFNLTPDGQAENIWADQLEWEGTKLYGRLANTPLAPEFSRGQRVLIERNLISDWSYFKGNVMQGGYTMRVMLDAMPADQAARLRTEFGW